jgi:hypothetical protein
MDRDIIAHARSLWEIMREFDAWGFASSVQQVTQYIWLAARRANDEEIDPSIVAELSALIEKLEFQTKKMQLKVATSRVTKELRWSLTAYGAPTWGKIQTELQTFWEIVEAEMRDRRFAHIELVKGEILSDLLGDPPSVPARDRQTAAPVWAYIWKSFPLAKEDCREAVYCYALERNTACVFHSMRAAEIGLRALARRMNVKLPKHKRLEWAQWQEILREMKDKTDVIAKTVKAGPAKDDLLEFYNGAIGQFYGFKDEFRNQVMHVRGAYDEFEAVRALMRVRDFMEKLAEKIDQNGRKVKRTVAPTGMTIKQIS